MFSDEYSYRTSKARTKLLACAMHNIKANICRHCFTTSVFTYTSEANNAQGRICANTRIPIDQSIVTAVFRLAEVYRLTLLTAFECTLRKRLFANWRH